MMGKAAKRRPGQWVTAADGEKRKSAAGRRTQPRQQQVFGTALR
jgi:hypothetical protein